MSEIQAYNGMLQSAPGIVFTLFAGPLTDSFGRKPLIISALFGYLLLDIIFLVNAYWFFELKVVLVAINASSVCDPLLPGVHSISASCAQVEYLLLECLQDLTGGATCFYLASYSYMSDVTTAETRTRRLSFLDAFMPIGFIIGLPIGTWLRNRPVMMFEEAGLDYNTFHVSYL